MGSSRMTLRVDNLLIRRGQSGLYMQHWWMCCASLSDQVSICFSKDVMHSPFQVKCCWSGIHTTRLSRYCLRRIAWYRHCAARSTANASTLCRSCNLFLSRLSHDCVRFIMFFFYFERALPGHLSACCYVSCCIPFKCCVQ